MGNTLGAQGAKGGVGGARNSFSLGTPVSVELYLPKGTGGLSLAVWTTELHLHS